MLKLVLVDQQSTGVIMMEWYCTKVSDIGPCVSREVGSLQNSRRRLHVIHSLAVTKKGARR